MKVTVRIRKKRPDKISAPVLKQKPAQLTPLAPTQPAVQQRPPLRVDHAGGYDHALLGLSDVLPAHLYKDALKKHL